MTKSVSSIIFLGVLLFSSCMLGFCGAAIIPAGSRLTAPIVCPADTRESVIVLSRSTSSKGGTSTTSDMYCIDAEGGGTKVSGFKVFSVITGVGAAIQLGLFALFVVIARLTRRSPGGRK